MLKFYDRKKRGTMVEEIVKKYFFVFPATMNYYWSNKSIIIDQIRPNMPFYSNDNLAIRVTEFH